ARRAYDLLAEGFGKGFNGPLLVVAQNGPPTGLHDLQGALPPPPGVVSVTPPRPNPAGNVATLSVYPHSAPQDYATRQLVSHLRTDVIPPLSKQSAMHVYVAGVPAGSVDFATSLGHKLPLFIGVVVLLSALLLMVVFRSLVIPLQAAFMNLLSIGAALGVIVVVF